MYGSTLWYLSCKNLHIIECALNKILGEYGTYPHILTQELYTVLVTFSQCLICCISRAVSSLSPLVKYVFKEASQCAYSFSSYNFISGHQHMKINSSENMLCAEVIRHYRIAFVRFCPFDDIIYIISCA